MGYVDRSKPENMFKLEVEFLVGKKQLGQIIEKCITDAWHRYHSGSAWTELKHRALNILPSGAITVAVCDAVIPPQKKELLEEADAEVSKTIINKQFRRGLISNEERYQTGHQNLERNH